MFWNKKKDADGVVQTTAGGLKKGHWALRFVGFILMVPVNLIKVLFKKKAKRVEGVAGDAVSEDVENSNAESSVMALPAVLDSKEKNGALWAHYLDAEHYWSFVFCIFFGIYRTAWTK